MIEKNTINFCGRPLLDWEPGDEQFKKILKITYDKGCEHYIAKPSDTIIFLMRKVKELGNQLHDVEATPMSEWAATLAAAKENVEGTAALLHEAEKRIAKLEAMIPQYAPEPPTHCHCPRSVPLTQDQKRCSWCWLPRKEKT
jgi:hypothetical protein